MNQKSQSLQELISKEKDEHLAMLTSFKTHYCQTHQPGQSHADDPSYSSCFMAHSMHEIRRNPFEKSAIAYVNLYC